MIAEFATPGDGAALQQNRGPASAGLLPFRWGRDALVAALGHLLAQHPWAADRLRMHAGRVIQFEWAPPPQWPQGWWAPPPIRLTVQADGSFGAEDGGDPPAVRMILRPSIDAAAALWREGAAGLQSHLRIEGDVMLAATVAELAQKLRWDWEEDLSRLVGDLAAHRIGRALRSVPQGLGELASRLSLMLTSAVERGEMPVVGRGELEIHRLAIDALASRLETLEASVSETPPSCRR